MPPQKHAHQQPENAVSMITLTLNPAVPAGDMKSRWRWTARETSVQCRSALSTSD